MKDPLRLLWFNLATDVDATGQGFTTDWINALAPYFASIDVVTMRAGRLVLDDKVRVFSIGKEKGYSEPRRAIEFYRILNRLLEEGTYDACFAHMQPLFAIMAAPLLIPRRIPITLWYTHKAVTPKLRLAEKVVHRVVTASPESFRIDSPKVRIVGHGIDTSKFTPAESPPDCMTILSVSRIRPAKQLETIIAAAQILMAEGLDFCLRIVGEAYAEDRSYEQTLHDMVRAQDLSDTIHFAGAVPHHEIAAAYQQASLMLNMSRTGSVDKAVLEAMACGLPVITANEAFETMLAPWRDQLLLPMDQPELLAAKIRAVAALSLADRQALGAALRQIVIRDHSLERLAGVLAAVFRSGELLEKAEFQP